MTDYAKYRQHIEKLTYKKQQLIETIGEKRKLHAEYRQKYKEHCAPIHKQYLKETTKEQQQRKELMDLIPENW